MGKLQVDKYSPKPSMPSPVQVKPFHLTCLSYLWADLDRWQLNRYYLPNYILYILAILYSYLPNTSYQFSMFICQLRIYHQSNWLIALFYSNLLVLSFKCNLV